METTLHRELKALYSAGPDDQEVAVDGFRIDVVEARRLVEIQSAPLGALRHKVETLLMRHDVLVVKPLAVRTRLVKHARRGGPVESMRYSPRRGTAFDLFSELVHFVGPFPHPRLALEVVLIEQDEHRIPARKRRRFGRDFRVTDRALRTVEGRLLLRSTADLARMLPPDLPRPFSTGDLARQAGIPRWLAQKMAWCLRKLEAVAAVGKSRNAVLYERRLPRHSGTTAVSSSATPSTSASVRDFRPSA